MTLRPRSVRRSVTAASMLVGLGACLVLGVGKASAGETVDLAVSVSDSRTAVDAGGQLEYVVRVSLRRGAPQRTIRLAASAPRGLTNVRFLPAAGRYDQRTGVWRNVSLRRGKPLLLKIRGDVPPTAQPAVFRLTVRALPRVGVLDAQPQNNRAADATSVRRPAPVADLALALDDGRDQAITGSTSTYRVTITNRGPSAVSAVSVRLSLPAGLGALSAVNASVGSYDIASATWSAITLAAAGSATLDFMAPITAAVGTQVRVGAGIRSRGGSLDPYSTNDAAADDTAVTAAPSAPPPQPTPPPTPPATPPTSADFAASVSSTGTFASRTYIFTVTNRGPGYTTMSAKFNLTAGSYNPPTVSRGVFNTTLFNVWQDPTVFLPGESQTLTIVIQNAVGASLTVTGGMPDPDPSNNTANG